MLARRQTHHLLRRQVGERIRERRVFLGMSQEELAWETGLAQGSISNYETGKSEVPLTALLDLCCALDVEPMELVPALGGFAVRERLMDASARTDIPDGNVVASRFETRRRASGNR